MTSQKAPDCPLCGHPPMFVVGGSQAFCGNDNCRCLNWDMSKTPAENMADVGEVDLGDLG